MRGFFLGGGGKGGGREEREGKGKKDTHVYLVSILELYFVCPACEVCLETAPDKLGASERAGMYNIYTLGM